MRLAAIAIASLALMALAGTTGCVAPANVPKDAKYYHIFRENLAGDALLIAYQTDDHGALVPGHVSLNGQYESRISGGRMVVWRVRPGRHVIERTVNALWIARTSNQVAVTVEAGERQLLATSGEDIHDGGKFGWEKVVSSYEMVNYFDATGLPAGTLANDTPPPVPAAVPSLPATAPAANQPYGRYHALVIGNSRYQSLPALKTARADAEAVAEVLRTGYGFDVALLADATRADVFDAMDRLRARLEDGDNLLMYYAGHGWIDGEADRGYWQPVDSRENHRAAWISNADVTDALVALRARHVLVVADSCYSGTLARTTRGLTVGPRRGPSLDAILAKRSRTVLASGGLEPVADGGGGSHSVFAKAFLDALRGNVGVMSGAELFAKVQQQVRLNARQTPQYQDIRFAGHELGGDFVFARPMTPAAPRHPNSRGR